MLTSAQARESPAAAIRGARWVIGGCLVLGVLAISLAVLKNGGFPLDDSWIHQVIGRNAARFGIPGFIPGVATAGSTSALWPWIVAGNYRFFPWLSPSSYLLAVNAVCLATVIGVLFAAARRDGLRAVEVTLLAALPALTGNLVWLMATGMEHLLFIATAFLAAHFWYARGQQAIHSVLAGMCCGLSIATRPEAVAFVPLFMLAGWHNGQSRRNFMGFLLPCMLFCALVMLNNLWTAHALMPATLSGRRGHWTPRGFHLELGRSRGQLLLRFQRLAPDRMAGRGGAVGNSFGRDISARPRSLSLHFVSDSARRHQSRHLRRDSAGRGPGHALPGDAAHFRIPVGRIGGTAGY
jgi:hypothetical protein